jgi:hypothetical protein
MHPDIPLMDGAAIPDPVRHVLEDKCADCHSERTRWPQYSRVAPASWLIERDVSHARSSLNLSAWTHYNGESQIDLLTRLAAEARSGEMPPSRYVALHPTARLTLQEQQMIYDWAKAERRRIRAMSAARPPAAEPAPAAAKGTARP